LCSITACGPDFTSDFRVGPCEKNGVDPLLEFNFIMTDMTEWVLAQLSTVCHRVFKLPFSALACDRSLSALRRCHCPTSLRRAIIAFKCCRCMHPLLPTSFPAPACHYGLQVLPLHPLHPLHASSAAAFLNSGTPLAPSSAAVGLPALPLCASSAAPFSTPACRQGLPALPLHASSAAAHPHSGMPSNAFAFPYVAALCCIASSHCVLEAPGGHTLCATLYAGDCEWCVMCAVGDGGDVLYASLCTGNARVL